MIAALQSPPMIDHAKVKSLRVGLGLSQQEAADRAGLKSRQYWNRIESGRRSNIELFTLDRIAKALGVKARDLLK